MPVPVHARVHDTCHSCASHGASPAQVPPQAHPHPAALPLPLRSLGGAARAAAVRVRGVGAALPLRVPADAPARHLPPLAHHARELAAPPRRRRPPRVGPRSQSHARTHSARIPHAHAHLLTGTACVLHGRSSFLESSLTPRAVREGEVLVGVATGDPAADAADATAASAAADAAGAAAGARRPRVSVARGSSEAQLLAALSGHARAPLLTSAPGRGRTRESHEPLPSPPPRLSPSVTFLHTFTPLPPDLFSPALPFRHSPSSRLLSPSLAGSSRPRGSLAAGARRRASRRSRGCSAARPSSVAHRAVTDTVPTPPPSA